MGMGKQLSLGVDMQVVDGIHIFMVVASASPQALSSEGQLSSLWWVTVVASVCAHHLLGADTAPPTDGTWLAVGFISLLSFSPGRARFHNFILLLG